MGFHNHFLDWDFVGENIVNGYFGGELTEVQAEVGGGEVGVDGQDFAPHRLGQTHAEVCHGRRLPHASLAGEDTDHPSSLGLDIDTLFALELERGKETHVGLPSPPCFLGHRYTFFNVPSFG